MIPGGTLTHVPGWEKKTDARGNSFSGRENKKKPAIRGETRRRGRRERSRCGNNKNYSSIQEDGRERHRRQGELETSASWTKGRHVNIKKETT